METVAVFSTQEYDKYFFEKNKLNSKSDLVFKYFVAKLTAGTTSLAKGCKIVCAFVNDILSKEVIDELYEGGTRLIALRCAGFNNVDLEAAKGRIKVVHVPSYSPHAIAEFAVGLMIALNRKIAVAYERTKNNNFSINGMLGFDMYNKTVGIVGTGKIGKVTIKLLSGFDLNIIAYDDYKDEEYAKKYDYRYVSLDELWAKSDIISFHAPLTPESMYLVNKESIAKMKKGVLLINTGRGQIINANDLIEGIKDQKIGGAALDVYENESEYFYYDFSGRTMKDDTLARLLSFKNVIITSHQAYFTYDALTNISNITISNIDDFLANQELENEVK